MVTVPVRYDGPDLEAAAAAAGLAGGAAEVYTRAVEPCSRTPFSFMWRITIDSGNATAESSFREAM